MTELNSFVTLGEVNLTTAIITPIVTIASSEPLTRQDSTQFPDVNQVAYIAILSCFTLAVIKAINDR